VVKARSDDANSNYSKDNKTILAGIYARTSSPSQDNLSIGAQVTECVNYCKERGWTVSHIFVDEFLDAKSIDNRPRFRLMMERAKSGHFNAVVGWKLDRLCRSLADLVNVERTLRTHGVQLCSVTENLDLNSVIGRFNFRSLASVAELEREMIGERARLGLYALARQGKWPNGHPPLGFFKGQDERLHIDRAGARLVRWIFRTYLRAKSLDHVAFLLNSKGVPVGNVKVIWKSRAVRDILKNQIYVGRFVVAGHTENPPHLRIIDDKTFKKVQMCLQRYQVGNAKRHPMPLSRKQAKTRAILERYKQFLATLA